MSFMKSAVMSLALRKAVSPLVMGATTTPSRASIAPIFPSVVLVITSIAHAASLPCSAKVVFNCSTPPQNAIPMAAHIMAMMDSAIIAPKNTGRACFSFVMQRAIMGDCVA